MADTGNNVRTGRRARHSLCPLTSYNEGELCPHAVHMAQWEDGEEADAQNSQGGCHQWMEQHGAAWTWAAEHGEPPLSCIDVFLLSLPVAFAFARVR